jgi:formylglycine-generating enzyme required for sulfatase activity
MEDTYMRDFLIRCIVLFPLAGAAFGETKEPPEKLTVDLGGEVKIEMVLIPAGEFLMGSPVSDKDARPNEKPQHRVRITKPFYLGKYLVTQEQWKAVMGKNPSQFKGPKNPVERVSWDDCQQFLDKLNAKSADRGGRKFQLPTEAQWEYACRAVSTTRYCFGNEESGLGEYAWYNANSGTKVDQDCKTHPVGEKKPNAWGLYDVHGNVWEWCADWYDDHEDYYAGSPTDDPTGPATGSMRVVRGGSSFSPASYCRAAARGNWPPESRRNFDGGLRVALVPADE